MKEIIPLPIDDDDALLIPPSVEVDGCESESESDRDEDIEMMHDFKVQDCEALDYDIIENELLLAEEKETTVQQWNLIEFQRFIICAIIGIFTGLTAVVIDISIVTIASWKMTLLESMVKLCVLCDCLWKPMLAWVGINGLFVMFAALLTTMIAPVAAGSGISQIKCYLNGVKVPEVVRLKTLFVKVIGIIASVSGGMAVGKEGPMIHSGAVIAAGISQGRSLTLKLTSPLFKHFRNDREKRDFVCAGAAAGVSAAFGAPVGGVLFSLEEAASFWNQSLTWRIFLCSILSSYTLNLMLSLYHGHAGDLAYPGLINFGKFEGTYVFQDLLIFFLMGALGGLFGAFFIAFNLFITRFRRKYIQHRLLQVVEAMLVAMVCGCLSFILMYSNIECKPLGQDPNVQLQFFCHDGEYNTMATLVYSTPESSVKSLFHDPLGSYSFLTLFTFVIIYFILACWTYGLKVPSGLFIPSLLIGAAWGRAVGMIVNTIWPDSLWTHDLAKYSLIGAAAQLGGTVRMTISLTVILIEATGNITYSLPLMAVLLIAKFVGDLFNKGIYDMHTELENVPILEWEPPPLSTYIKVSQIMHQPPITINTSANVGDVLSLLKNPVSKHGGYPVVNEKGIFRGLILRSQLLILIEHKCFVERAETEGRVIVPLSVFRDNYPRYYPANLLNVSQHEYDYHIDITPYINKLPHTVHENSSLPRIFQLFRALGLRHLVVLNDESKVVGLITRKDLFKINRLKMVQHGEL